jgi:subfamily B ATP-binding cassette protein HlyB/CyaB
MNFPVKLKSECTNQIDQQLLSLGCSTFIGVAILSNIVEDHISTSIVLEALNQIEEIEYEWKVLIGNFDVNCPNETLLCLTHNGDSFLLSQKEGSNYWLKRYYRPGEEIESFWVTYEEMIKGLGILPQALSITKKESASALVQPFLAPPSKDASDDKNATKEHYAIKHFRRQSRTALSIIGISVVIALLGVIAPLGFQTFTDKILPYQAQSSLMVIAILLLVAAIRKVPQKVVLSPLAKAAHKKTL